MEKNRGLVYGTKKDFIVAHFDDIMLLRRRHSVREVVEIYGGAITLYDMYRAERMYGYSKGHIKKDI